MKISLGRLWTLEPKQTCRQGQTMAMTNKEKPFNVDFLDF